MENNSSCSSVIPWQLQESKFRFSRLQQRGKIPIDKRWQKEGNFSFNDPILKKWRERGGNFGTVCGNGGLLVIDFDNKDYEKEKFPLLPKTFTVRTGRGLHHCYFICNETTSAKVVNEQGKTLVDIQGKGKLVVGPGSIHPNGERYIVVDNSPIAKIERRDLDIIFSRHERLIVPSLYGKRTAEIGCRRNMVDVLRHYGFDLRKNPTQCLVEHGCKGGKCFWYFSEENRWYCFSHTNYGSPFDLIMKMERFKSRGVA